MHTPPKTPSAVRILLALAACLLLVALAASAAAPPAHVAETSLDDEVPRVRAQLVWDAESPADEPRVGVLLEMACNTDFAANSNDFRQFTHELAMHIAAARPRYLVPEDVPEDELEEEKTIYRKQVEKEDKPPQIMEKIIEGRLKKFYTEACLLKQPFVRDPSRTVEDLLAELCVKTGETILIKRFARYEVGKGA